MGCNCKKPMPSVFSMATSLAVAASAAAVRSVSGGTVKASPEVKNSRMAICLGCEFMSISSDKTAHRCSECGCWLDGGVLCKTCIATESCPKGKWGAV